ncbi:AraC family transcriptional regulator ligand-binding domain-containing protein [Brucellaceae bacterium D45D]
MMNVGSIRASLLGRLITHIAETDLSVDDILSRHGLHRTQILDPYKMVPLSRYIPLFEDAAHFSGMPDLGARLGTMVKSLDLGPTGVLFSISATVLDGLNRITGHVNAIQGATSNELLMIGGYYVWSYQLSNTKLWPRRQDSEFTLSTMCQLIRSSFTRNWRPLEVHFEHPEPTTSSRLQAVFRAPIKFGQSTNRLIIAPADIERVYRSEDPNLVSVLERHIFDLETKENTSHSLQKRVRSLIAIHLGYTRITISLIASDLEMAPRTLQRRLQEEGTSLRAMVERYRMEIMDKQIKANAKKMRIADILGYTDSTALWRARKGWLGKMK